MDYNYSQRIPTHSFGFGYNSSRISGQYLSTHENNRYTTTSQERTGTFVEYLKIYRAAYAQKPNWYEIITMPIDNKTPRGIIGPQPRTLPTDADVIAEAVRILRFLTLEFIPLYRLRCKESEEVLFEQETLLCGLKEDKEMPEDELEVKIKEVEEEVADSLKVLNYNQDVLMRMENDFMKLSQLLGYLKARSAGLDLSVRLDVGRVDMPPGMWSASYAEWESRRQSQLVTANLDRACIIELREICLSRRH